MSENQDPQLFWIEETISSWDGLVEFYNQKLRWPNSSKGWIFRGDNPIPDQDKPGREVLEAHLMSSLDRAFMEFGHEEAAKRFKIEEKLIREFRRKAPIHIPQQRPDDLLECMALMRHYGAPSRMLDWNYTFFVAVYFALNRAENNGCVVWALDGDWFGEANGSLEEEFLGGLRNEITQAQAKDGTNEETKKLCKKLADLEDLRANYPNRFQKEVIQWLRGCQSPKGEKPRPRQVVYAVNPYYLNERLSVQCGVLLFPGDTSVSWGANFATMLEKHAGGSSGQDRKDVRLLMVPIGHSAKKKGQEQPKKEEQERNAREWMALKKDILRGLFDMNISQASLFPDLGGFAESLRTRIAHPETLDRSLADKSH